MNKSATIDFATASNAPAQTQALLELVAGEARDSLLGVHDVLRRELPQGRVAIYEAGGGSSSFLPMDVLARSHVTVVDIDEDQVRNNTYADKAILGDVQTYRFGPETFDVVICYNVIEHLPDVEAALLNFRDALKRGGMILIGAPNPHSLSGVVTKYSPHWFHVWFYRNIRGIRNAGLPGEPPFPTFFHPLVTLPKLEAFAAAHGLETIYRREVESPRYPEMRQRKPLFAALVDAGAALMNAVLPGGTDVRRGDYHIILRKR
ncbi:class I SAM-dependent methyltransferase [Bradyrhizobium sp. INPA01-394B]|uniref:Class I SAM-dependent methyltransferase n=1 Tax=Bradyrhizobium campsiandrae TaxID=1729892 RepID=A0ABR7UHP4_9BRAD|nr:class I SAM-dependent methyltransferase [Bradyrhizobium campsiandrae]MBC9879663.1 class I SAM-dependent methyltransferase [Bradyrhizobium campsiandrae]MBC9983618.1 class I SAM-dependent methyltransferase [Bradyrhizobium campsiandrae]